MERDIHLGQPHRLGPGENDPGLYLIYEPEEGQSPYADIILIHGLGGSSRYTWTWNARPWCFWPKEICEKKRLQMARVWTFGYSSSAFNPLHRNSVEDIESFATDLLCRLKDWVDGVSIYSTDNTLRLWLI